MASSYGQLEAVKCLDKKGSAAYVTNKYGSTSGGDLDMVKWLVMEGADLHALDNRGWTEMHEAFFMVILGT